MATRDRPDRARLASCSTIGFARRGNAAGPLPRSCLHPLGPGLRAGGPRRRCGWVTRRFRRAVRCAWSIWTKAPPTGCAEQPRRSDKGVAAEPPVPSGASGTGGWVAGYAAIGYAAAGFPGRRGRGRRDRALPGGRRARWWSRVVRRTRTRSGEGATSRTDSIGRRNRRRVRVAGSDRRAMRLGACGHAFGVERLRAGDAVGVKDEG